MATVRSVPGSGYGNVYIDSLIWGGKAWDLASGPIKVYFGERQDFAAAQAFHRPSAYLHGADALVDWTRAEFYAFDYAVGLYESVCGVRIDLAGSVGEADIVWWKTDLGGRTYASHEIPDTEQVWGYFNPYIKSWSYRAFGGDGLNTIIHELGHGVGLAHPHGGGWEADATRFPGVTSTYDTGTNGMNQGIFTVMSYNTGWAGEKHGRSSGAQAGLGALDIAALQALYGANTATATGNDVYKLPTSATAHPGWFCIWDAGGTDTISAAGAAHPVTIDLRAATLVQGDRHAGGFISHQPGTAGGFTIAHGVTLENAVGGSGGDTLLGNAAANRIRGNGGSDRLSGSGGNDALYGASGSDRLSGGAGQDLLSGGSGLDSLRGGPGQDVFVFDAAVASRRNQNVDAVRDFNPADDTVRLRKTVFTHLKAGELKPDAFWTGARAHDASDRILYDDRNGFLSYDPDGSGHAAAIHFATLPKHLKGLSHHDFVVV